MCNNYIPGDSRLIEKLLSELKSQGIFDQFRKECISDVDTKPAYQNLKQRVEGSVTTFLKQQTWSIDLNKNQLREQLRKNLLESGFLETGVERIVDQVVNPKINTVFLPKVEEIVYRFLGVDKPVRTVKKEVNISITDLLPTDLEAVSPESVHSFKTGPNKDYDTLTCSLSSIVKQEEDESPPFEPLNGNRENNTANDDKMIIDENTRDSHLSGFSGLESHDSIPGNSDNKCYQMELSNQDSQVSQISSESHLSMFTSEETTKMDVCEDSIVEANVKKSEQQTEVTLVNETENNTINDTIEIKNESRPAENKNNEKDIEKRFVKAEEKKPKSSEKSSKEKKDDKHKKSSSSNKDKEKSSKSSQSKYKESREKERKNSKSSSSRDREKDITKEKFDKDKEKSDKEKSSKKTDKEKYKSDKERSEKDKVKHDKSKSEKETANKIEKEKTEKDKVDKERSRERSDKSKPEKDRPKSEFDKSKHGKDKSLREKDKNARDKYKEKSDKSSKTKEKSDREKEKSSRDKSSRDRASSSKESKEKESTKEIKDNKESNKECSKDKNKEERNKSSSSSSKHSSGKDKKTSTPKNDLTSQSTYRDKSYSTCGSAGDSKSKANAEKTKKDETTDKHTSNKKDTQKETKKKSKDDHYSSKINKTDRRSTDRDSNDGHSSKNYSNAYSESSRSENNSQDYSSSSFTGGSGDSSNSDKAEAGSSEEKSAVNEVANTAIITEAPKVKYIKPKFALNFEEARKIMKIRKQLAILEKQNKLSLAKIELPFENNVKVKAITLNKNEDAQKVDISEEKENINVSKQDTESTSYENPKNSFVSTIEGRDLSKENWEALEAKLAQVMSYVNCNAYESDEDFEFHGYSSVDIIPKHLIDLSMNLVKKTEMEIINKQIAHNNNKESCENHLSNTNNASEYDGKKSIQDVGENITYSKRLPNDTSSVINGSKLKNCTTEFESKINNDCHAVLNKTCTNISENACYYLEKPTQDDEYRIRYIHEVISNLEKEMIGFTLQDSSPKTLQKIGRKRKFEEVHVKNNNNATYMETEKKRRISASSQSVVRVANKKNSTDVTPTEMFPLPLSPAESDKSNERKDEDLLIPIKQKRIVRGYSQRYSSDDLYKPRPTVGRNNFTRRNI